MEKMPVERTTPNQEKLGSDILHLISGYDVSASREMVESRLRLLAIAHLLPDAIAKDILEHDKDGKA